MPVNIQWFSFHVSERNVFVAVIWTLPSRFTASLPQRGLTVWHGKWPSVLTDSYTLCLLGLLPIDPSPVGTNPHPLIQDQFIKFGAVSSLFLFPHAKWLRQQGTSLMFVRILRHHASLARNLVCASSYRRRPFYRQRTFIAVVWYSVGFSFSTWNSRRW